MGLFPNWNLLLKRLFSKNEDLERWWYIWTGWKTLESGGYDLPFRKKVIFFLSIKHYFVQHHLAFVNMKCFFCATWALFCWHETLFRATSICFCRHNILCNIKLFFSTKNLFSRNTTFLFWALFRILCHGDIFLLPHS